MPQITALPGKAVVVLKAAESATASGIVIPDTVQSDFALAIVVSSGLVDVESGDTVLLSNKYAGSSFVVDDTEYVAVEQDEVIAVIEEND